MQATTHKVKLRCPVCGKKLSCTPDKVGRMAQCPHCGDTVRVAAPGLAPLEAESAAAADAPATTPQERHTAVPRHRSVPHTTLDTGSSSLVWKALFFSVSPMALLLGVFLGYALRPPTPQELVENAQQEAQSTVEEAQRNAEQILAQAQRDAAAMAPPTRRTTGQDAAAQMVRARNYLPRVQLAETTVGLSPLGLPALVGEVRNAGDRTVQMVELTLSYRSATGSITQHKEHYPVDARPGAVGYTPPLEPGGSTSFVISLDDLPENAEKPTVKVTGVALQE